MFHSHSNTRESHRAEPKVSDLKILLVTDNEAEARLLTHILNSCPLATITVSSIADAAEAIALLRAGFRPDFILLSYTTSIIGPVCLSALMSEPRLSEFPVVVLTALESPQALADIRRLANWCLPKPLDLEGHEALIANLVQFWLHSQPVMGGATNLGRPDRLYRAAVSSLVDEGKTI